MKRLIAILTLVIIGIPSFAKGDWKGKVVDENGEPVPYANVAVLSKADSTVVCGAVITLEPDGVRVTSFSDKPIGIAQLFNTFTIGDGWQLELGGTVWTPGYNQNMYMRNWYFDLSTAVQKTLLKDGSLVLRLEGADLLGTAHFDAYSDFGSHTIMQTNRMDTQRVKFSLRYNFNTAQSKYRGSGAGADSRERM